MDRKTFLKTAGRLGCAGACGLLWPGTPAAAQQDDCAPASFVGKTHRFIADIMRALDGEVDEATRQRVMARCGRACFASSEENVAAFTRKWGGRLDDLVAALEKESPEQCRREGATIYFSYGNPKGTPADRRDCLCPIVQKAPPGLSATFCACSVGYVTEMFERAAGRPVRVVLLESLKRGGKACRFRVQV